MASSRSSRSGAFFGAWREGGRRVRAFWPLAYPTNGPVYPNPLPLVSTLLAVNALHAWMRWGLWVFAVGGALWVLKVVFITLNDATGRATDALPVPIFYLSAVLLMAIGATAVGIAVLRRFPWWAQVLGALAAVIALWLLYTVLDGILKPTFEGVGPSWLHEELGILATGGICLVGGVLLARTVAAEQRDASARAT